MNVLKASGSLMGEKREGSLQVMAHAPVGNKVKKLKEVE